MGGSMAYGGERRLGFSASTPVMTMSGWRPLSKVGEGDQVFSAGGEPARVRRVLDHGVNDVIRVVIDDGTSLESALDQFWPVEVGTGGGRTRRDVPTSVLEALFDAGRSIRVLRSSGVELPARPLPLDPYLLGLIIGDGAISSNKTVKIWNCSPQIRDAIEAALPGGARLSDHPSRSATTTGWGIVGQTRAPGQNPVLNGLRELGLSGLMSYDKFLPPIYLWASAEQRLALLQGLLDTDGSCSRLGSISFSTASEQLANDVLYLINSLGGRASLNRRTGVTYTSPTQRTKKSARDSFRLTGIRLFGAVPFRLERKAALATPVTRHPQWSVRAVTPAGQCRTLSLDLEGRTAAWLASGFVPVAAAPPAGLALPLYRLGEWRQAG